MTPMSTDYAEKERDFIASLNEDTGRDLAGWMAAISNSGHTERNEIIDWLRLQGFQFAKASWLERIHHNGGRLIYADDGGFGIPGKPAPADPLVHGEPPRLTPVPAHLPRDTAASGASGDVKRALGEAKGLRPLADLILREVARAVPHVRTRQAARSSSCRRRCLSLLCYQHPNGSGFMASFGADGVHRAKLPTALTNRCRVSRDARPRRCPGR